MSIIRVHKTNNFTVMSNYHFKEKGMSLKAKGLLSLMLSLPDNWNYSISGLVTLSKDGKDSVMSALAELEKFGYLNRARLTNDKGQFSGVEYNIFEEPKPKIPVADNQNEEKQEAGKANEGKPLQLNTNQLNINNNKNINRINTKGTGEFEDVLTRITDNQLKQLYKDYIDMRNSIDAPITKRGLEMLVSRCERLSKMNVRAQKVLLETAIINNWKNVYSPKDEELPTGSDKVDELRRFYDLS